MSFFRAMKLIATLNCRQASELISQARARIREALDRQRDEGP
jgi:cellobiose-specific phosphotransferase system component IIA